MGSNELARQRADRAVAWLLILATAALWVALALSSTGIQPVLALLVTVCQRSLQETLEHGAELGRLTLLFPLGLGLLLATIEASRLLAATRRWTAALDYNAQAPSRRLRRLAERCGLRDALTLIHSDRPFVFTEGLLRPRVWLSTRLLHLLASDELEAVLRHEAHHRSARDPLKILAARCLSRGLFFVPVARDLCQAYSVAKEIAADTHATRAMQDARPLARALRKLIAAPFLNSPALTVVSGLSVTEARLRALLEPGQAQPLFRSRHLGISLAWLLLLLTVFLAPAATHLPSFSECSPSALARSAQWLAVH
jgi:Zn-dependent protease with chaperone function